jgi:hypothetical protein
MESDKKKIILNTLFWGFILWLFGYVLGIIFFAFIPKEVMGWYIMPFGLAATLWVLLKKIKRESFTCYVGLGVIWTIMAIVLDYFFLVKLFKAVDYYKIDVYIYYFLTLFLPIIVGLYKFNKIKK